MSETTFPLISCIMPTRGRRAFVERSIAMFLAQDYPNKELVIVEDGPECNYDIALGLAYHHIGNGAMSIGAKRNSACHIARGEIICHWDDDDYYGPHRLSRQVQPLLEDTADITGLTMDVVFAFPAWHAWRCTTPELHREVFISDIHTGTLLYRKALWNAVRFADTSSGEDADFVRDVCANGARLARVVNENDFVYVRHAHTTWPLPPHPYPHMQDWRQVAIEDYLSSEDRAFYASMRSGRQHEMVMEVNG